MLQYKPTPQRPQLCGLWVKLDRGFLINEALVNFDVNLCSFSHC